VGLVVAAVFQVEAGQEEVPAFEPGIELLRLAQAEQEEGGAHQGHEREGHLADDEQAAQLDPAARRRGAGLLERLHQVGPS
jgi:hypothetical protein